MTGIGAVRPAKGVCARQLDEIEHRFMTDFYSVLKSSIIQRNLRSSSDRHNVYGQAREAMIRRLWSLDPPLSEDEITTRIGLFDNAVERIEADLERTFAVPHNPDRQPPRPATAQAAPASERVPQKPGYAGHRETIRRQEAVVRKETIGRHETLDRQEAIRRAAVGQRLRRPDRTAATAPPAAREPRQSFGPNGRGHRPIADEPRPMRPAYDERASDAQAHEPLDEEWPVAEEYVAAARPQLRAPEPRYRQAPRQRPIYDSDTVEEAAYVDDIGDEVVERSDRGGLPAVVESPIADEPPYDDENYGGEQYAYEGDGYADDPPQGEIYRQPLYEEAAYYEYDEYEGDQAYEAAGRPRPARKARRGGRQPANDAYAYADEDFEAPPTRRRPAERRTGKRAKPKRTNRSPRTGSRTVPILVIALSTLALILVAFNVYVFLPMLLGSDQPEPAAAPVATAAATSKIEDRVPSLETPGAATIVRNSATAVEIPERNLDIAETLVVFDGTDPTVFEGTSNNPIHFDSDSEGGFARISSAVSAAGARAVIGPGLAERLAGRTVRVTLLARSSNENGAAQMRFAYQSGLAVSHWQSANLSPNYGTYGMIWRVPAADPGARDYLLIEPGIPGDGTGTDIRMIKIDILAS